MTTLSLPAWSLVAAVSTAPAGDAMPAMRDASGRPAFVELARRSTEPYQDRSRAVADGYRLIGRDFPGMGEHWVHIGLLFDGVYDPTRPEFLTYVTINGKPRLLGVAYGLPLLAGESPPDEPAGQAAWHDHGGTLDEETLHPRHGVSGHGAHGPRLSMVHAWVWLPNPDGLFAADNWAIPLLRLGLEAEAAAPHSAAKALSLLTGGDAYLGSVVAEAAHTSPEQSRAVDAVLARARERAATLVRGLGRASLTSADIDAASVIWGELWRDIETCLPAEARTRLRELSVR